MSTTIFCTFDQQDLADLAMGELRSTTTGINSIHYVGDYNSRKNILNAGTANNSLEENGSWAGLFPANRITGPVMPSKPVNVKIVCSDAAAEAVKSRLINLHAYQIITMR